MAQYDRRATENGHGNHDTPPVALWSCCAGTGVGRGGDDLEIRRELSERLRS